MRVPGPVPLPLIFSANEVQSLVAEAITPREEGDLTQYLGREERPGQGTTAHAKVRSCGWALAGSRGGVDLPE